MKKIKEWMNSLLRFFNLDELSVVDRWKVLYLIVSFLMLSISTESSLMTIVMVVLNFGNAVRLILTIELDDDEL